MPHYGRDRRQDGKLFVWKTIYSVAQYCPFRCPAARWLHRKSLCRLLSTNDPGTASWIHDTSVKGFMFVIVTRRAKLKALRAPDIEIARSTGLSMPPLTHIIGHSISLNGVSSPVSYVSLTQCCKGLERWNCRDVVEWRSTVLDSGESMASFAKSESS